MAIRNAIIAELARRGMSKYELAKAVETSMTNQTVYQFLSGRQDMTVSKVERLMDALGLTVVARVGTPKPPRRVSTRAGSSRRTKKEPR